MASGLLRPVARLVRAAGLFISLALLWPASAVAQDETATPALDASPITIGGGVPFGLYYPLAGAICQLIERQGGSEDAGAARSCRVASLSDSAAAIAALQQAEVDLALVQSDWLAHAAAGTSRFQEAGPAEDLRSVAALHGEGLVMMVRAGEGLERPADLQGLRVSRGAEQSYRALLTYALLGAVDLSTDDLAMATAEPVADGLAKLCRAEVDAVAAITARPAQAAAAAPAGCAVAYLTIDPDAAEEAAADMPGVEALLLPLDGPDGRRLSSFGMTAVLAASANADPAVVADAARAILSGARDLAALHPALSTIAPERLERAADFAPLHPAAKALYRGE